MHRLRVLSFSLVMIAACGPRGFGSFGFGYETGEQVVPGSPVAGLLGNLVDAPIPLDIDLEAETAAHATGVAQHVYLTSLSLDLTATAEPGGDSDDFDFLDRVEIYIQSSVSGSTLPRQRVAFVDAVPRGARTLALTVENVDLIGYVREGAVLTSSASGRVPPDDVSFIARLTFAVEVL
jgi:hypothetical protein